MEVSLDSRAMKRIVYVILLVSTLYVLAVSGWILTENRSILTVMELLTIWAAIAIVQFMAELYRASGEKRKGQALLALVLSACMAAITVMNHFIYMTVLTPVFGAETMPAWLLLDRWPSVSMGLECAAWGFFLGLAMLFAAGSLADWGGKALAWTMRVGGLLTLAGLIGPLLGNMIFYHLSTAGYSAGFLVLSIQMIVRLNQKVKP